MELRYKQINGTNDAMIFSDDIDGEFWLFKKLKYFQPEKKSLSDFSNCVFHPLFFISLGK